MISSIRDVYKKIILRNAKFATNYRRLRMLYSIEDPWDLDAKKEQYRFRKTNEMLADLVPARGALLEVGCGEGHQTRHLVELGLEVYGLDVSPLAVKRAGRRCGKARLAVAQAEDADKVFTDVRFDVVVACEVLYYARDVKGVVEKLQALAPQLFVSNYQPRSQVMRQHFAGPGWRQLENIEYDETVWECFHWQCP